MATSIPFPSLLATLVIAPLLLIALYTPLTSSAFAPLIAPTLSFQSHRARSTTCQHHRPKPWTTLAAAPSSPEDNNNVGVIDLTDDDEDDSPQVSTVRDTVGVNAVRAQAAAPFLSQGELSNDPNLLSPDFTDGKQSRVIIYIVLTLVPILFLVPLMIGSRDLIPLDALPPVEMTN